MKPEAFCANMISVFRDGADESGGTGDMKPVYLSIQTEATGNRIRRLLQEKGLTVRDVQTAYGFEYPQAVYKWLSGSSLPSLDNMVILSRILHTSIEDILVVEEHTEAGNSSSGIVYPGAVLLLGQGPVFWPGVFRVPKNGGAENQKTTCYASG